MQPSTEQDSIYMRAAIALAAEHMGATDGGPFGAIITRGAAIVARGWTKVTSTNDPTAHAEVTAIRAAAASLNTFVLSGCVLYTSCEPCPMCLGAAYWARVDRIVFAATRADAAAIGFDDARIYEELSAPLAARKLPIHEWLRGEGVAVMREWDAMPGKTLY